MNGDTVAKFGGSALADARQILKVVGIIRADPWRRYIVVSAPGRRSMDDWKITDLLYALYQGGTASLSPKDIIQIISKRFRGIARELGLQFNPIFEVGMAIIQNAPDPRYPISMDFLVSRGEFLIATMLAEALGYEFVDARGIIRFNASGQFDWEATKQNLSWLTEEAKGYVIPGFYGSMPDGTIKTFPRNGSDVTGAIITALVGARLYENWTDVPGMLMADPAIVPNAEKIGVATFREQRELAYNGASVLHEDVILMMRRAGVPIQIRNVNQPEDKGTFIVPDFQVPQRKAGSIVGVAGRKDFTVITIEKILMNGVVGFIGRICAIFEEHRINIEHMPGGIDTLSVVVRSDALSGKLNLIKTEIERQCEPDSITISPDIALICTVGHAIAHTPGVAARLFQAVGDAGINVRMIDQGSSELSIIIGVKNGDYENAVRAIYGAFAIE